MELRLSVFAAGQKREIFDALRRGEMPPVGRFDEEIWRAGKEKGEVQMGTTVYLPGKITYEYIYQDMNGSNLVLGVSVVPPERIVFLPVPKWVVENIWQGEVNGSFVFESEARVFVEELEASLSVEGNLPLFAPPGPKRKD
ncbi:MAG: hypothetical protein ACKVQS_01470 [Fimbriimonadaceae bacterium]